MSVALPVALDVKDRAGRGINLHLVKPPAGRDQFEVVDPAPVLALKIYLDQATGTGCLRHGKDVRQGQHLARRARGAGAVMVVVAPLPVSIGPCRRPDEQQKKDEERGEAQHGRSLYRHMPDSKLTGPIRAASGAIRHKGASQPTGLPNIKEQTMTRTILFTTALGSALALFALGANAQQGPAQGQGMGAQQVQQQVQVQKQARIMTIAQIAAQLEEQGYTIREIELERGVYEAEMIDANGMRVKAYLNAATGQVLPYGDDEGGEYGDNDRYRDRDGSRYDD